LALVTAAEYKAYAGISDTSQDARLAVLIPAIQDEIERYCGRGFESAVRVEHLDGTGTGEIRVSNAPIISLESVSIIYGEGDLHEYSSTAYTFTDDDTGAIWLYGGRFADRGLDVDGFPVGHSEGRVWPKGRKNIRVEYTGGYTAIPPALKLVVYRLLDEAIVQAGKDMSLQSESLGAYSYSRGAAVASEVSARYSLLLSKWRRVAL
jgi:hypothetical protein